MQKSGPDSFGTNEPLVVSVLPRVNKDDGLLKKLGSSRIPALDGLRALAVFCVIFYHFAWHWFPASLGVLAFFVLSGFLITWLLLKENDKHGSVSIGNFYKRRALRILPAFYFYWGAWLLLLLVSGRMVAWPDTMSAFFYVSNYYQGLFHPGPSFVSHTWSLAIEEQFYLLWPVAFYLGRRNLARLTWYVVGIIGFVWTYRLVLSLVFHVDQAYIYRAFDTRIDHLMIGCVTAIVVKRGVLRQVWTAISAKLYFPLITLILLVFSSFLTMQSSLYRDVVGFAVEPVLVALLMIQLIMSSATPQWGWFDSAPLRYLGQISYSLYLYHPVVGDVILKRVPGTFPIRLAVAVVATIVVASASYYFIEKPFLRLKDRIGAGYGHFAANRVAVAAD